MLNGHARRSTRRGESRPAKLWKSLSSIRTSPEKDFNSLPASLKLSADDFLKFLEQKVANVWAGTDGNNRLEELVPAETSFTGFQTISADDVHWMTRIIMASPTKSGSLDPTPTSILKEALLSGQLPVLQRHAIITPLLKKSSFDAAELKNYQPVSNLTFVSKVTERMVSEQLFEYLYLQANNLMHRMKSAYRRHHST